MTNLSLEPQDSFMINIVKQTLNWANYCNRHSTSVLMRQIVMLLGNCEQLNYFVLCYTFTRPSEVTRTGEWCIDVVCCFIWKGDGEIHHWWAWLFSAGGRSWGPVFLLAAEPHRDRWIHLTNTVLIKPQAVICSWIQSSPFREAYIMPLCCSLYIMILIRPFFVFTKSAFLPGFLPACTGRFYFVDPPLGHESLSMWPEITVCARILFGEQSACFGFQQISMGHPVITLCFQLLVCIFRV